MTTFKQRRIAFFLTLILCTTIFPFNTIAVEEDYDLIDVIDSVVSSESNVITSTAAKDKAIVIVPGILGSSLRRSDTKEQVWLNIYAGELELNEDGSSKYPIESVDYDHFGANNTYQTLYSELSTAYKDNFDIIFFDYDWRMSNTEAATKLASELSSYTTVVLVAHSMAGWFVVNSFPAAQLTGIKLLH